MLIRHFAINFIIYFLNMPRLPKLFLMKYLYRYLHCAWAFIEISISPCHIHQCFIIVILQLAWYSILAYFTSYSYFCISFQLFAHLWQTYWAAFIYTRFRFDYAIELRRYDFAFAFSTRRIYSRHSFHIHYSTTHADLYWFGFDYK